LLLVPHAILLLLYCLTPLPAEIPVKTSHTWSRVVRTCVLINLARCPCARSLSLSPSSLCCFNSLSRQKDGFNTRRRRRYWCPCVETACLVVVRSDPTTRKKAARIRYHLHTELTSAHIYAGFVISHGSQDAAAGCVGFHSSSDMAQMTGMRAG
jgi:hypothetical protein